MFARIARINAYLGEAISGMAVIQLFAREEKTYREFEKLNADHRDAYHLSNLYEAGLYSMVEAAGSVSVGLLLWYGGGEVLHGAIGIGTLVAFKEYIHRFFVPLRDFSQKYTVMQSAMASAERIFQLLDTPLDVTSPKNAVVPKPFQFGYLSSKWLHDLAVQGDAIKLPENRVIDTGVQVIKSENVAEFEKNLAEMKSGG